MRRALLVVVGLLLAVGVVMRCSPEEEVVPRPEDLKKEGDAYAAKREWGHATERYRLAFALEDPVPERARARAWLAYHRGLTLARIPLAADAGRWLDRALRLDPDLYVVHFERGLLHDGRHPETADRKTAREAFERFLAESERAGSPPGDGPVAEEARRLLRTLTD